MYWGVELNHFISFLGTHTLFQCWQVLLLCWGKEQQPEDDDSGGDLETQAHTSCQRCKTHVRWAESRDLNQIFGACNRYRRVLWRTLRRWTEDDQQKCFWLFLSSWAKREIIYTSPTSQGLHCIRLAPRYLSFGTERAARTSWGTRNGCNRVFKNPGDDPCANFRKGRFSFGNFVRVAMYQCRGVWLGLQPKLKLTEIDNVWWHGKGPQAQWRIIREFQLKTPTLWAKTLEIWLLLWN